MTSFATPFESTMGARHLAEAVPAFAGARRGSELRHGEPQMVVCTRHGNPPLRFKGFILSRHWVSMSAEKTLKVDLFKRLKGNLVLSHSIISGTQIAIDALQLPDVATAAGHLEAVCAQLDATVIGTHEGALPWADAHFHLCFGQCFAMLIADVLDDWQSLFTLQE